MAPQPWRRPVKRETAVDPRAFMLTSSARSRLDLERAGRAAADKAAAVPSYAAQTGGLRRATLTRRPHAGLPELGQARSGRMPVAQFASDGRRSRPSKTCPSSGTTVSELRQAGCSQVRLSRESKIRSPLSAVVARASRSRPPIAADVGGLEPSAPRVASAGQTLSRGQSSHLFVPSALARSIPQGQARE